MSPDKTQRPERPWWNRPEVGAAGAFVVVLAVRLLFGSGPIEAVVNAVWLAAVSYFVVRWRWHSDAKRLDTGSDEVRAADEWIQAEKVPDDPEQRRVVADVLARRRHQMTRRRARIAMAVLAVMFVGLAVAMLLTGEWGTGILMIAAGVFVGVLAYVTRRKALRRLETMERLLAEAPEGPRTPPAREVNASGTPAGPRTPSRGTSHRPAR